MIMIIIRSRWYIHKVWYTTNEHRGNIQSQDTANIQKTDWEKYASRTRQVSNVDAVKNEALSATGQKALTAWSALLKMNTPFLEWNFCTMHSGSCVHVIRMFHFWNFSLANRIFIIKGLKKVKMGSPCDHLNECPSFSQNPSETSRGQEFSFSTREINSEEFDQEEEVNINNSITQLTKDLANLPEILNLLIKKIHGWRFCYPWQFLKRSK